MPDTASALLSARVLHTVAHAPHLLPELGCSVPGAWMCAGEGFPARANVLPALVSLRDISQSCHANKANCDSCTLKVDPKTMSGSSHSDACKEKQGRRTVLCKAVLRKSQ